MGVRFNDLETTSYPTSDDWVAVLDNDSTTLKITPLDNAVKCTLGSANISGIGDGTVNGAIVYLYQNSGGEVITGMSQSTYDSLSPAEKDDGTVRWVYPG